MDKEQKLSPEELAKHLRQPDGEIGVAVGNEMNKGNIHINMNSFKLLNIENADTILEIGFGNGKLIENILSLGKNLRYVGIDYSQTMVEEAKMHNGNLIESGTIELHQGNIDNLPFDNNSFDKIVTVNTLYFWDDPKKTLSELKRVVKPGGRVVIGFREKNQVESLPFTNFGFTLYNNEDVLQELKKSDFQNIEIINIEEPSINFNGNTHVLTGSFGIGIG